MLDTLYSQVGAVFTVLVVAFAFLKGDEPEKIGAGAYAMGWVASMLVQDDGNLYGVQWSMLAVDIAMLGVLGGLVWKWRRAWSVWATAFQLLVIASHTMMLIDQRPPVSAYYFVINLAAYGLLIAIAVGTFWAWQERRAAGLE
jgi:hypothetical protein